MIDRKSIFEFVSNKDLEGLINALDPNSPVEDVYEWLLIAEDYGVPGAPQAVEDFWNAEVSRWGDEADASLQIEVAFNHLLGENCLPKNEEMGFRRLEKSKGLKPFQRVNLQGEIDRVLSKISPGNQKRLQEFIKS